MSTFRHRVNIKQDTSADGEVDPTYATLWKEVPCNIVPVTGGENYRGKQLQAETQYVIETRYYSGIAPNMIAVNTLDSTQYLISKLIDVNGRQRFYMIEATEVVV